MRALGLAFGELALGAEATYENLLWVGLVALIDPILKAVHETIAACSRAGIRIVINLLTDVFRALALSFEPAEPQVMQQPPRNPAAPILSRQALTGMASDAGLISAVTLDTLGLTVARYGAIALAHRLARRLDEVRQAKLLRYLGQDGKTLVAAEFGDGQPIRIHTVIVGVQHAADLEQSATGDVQAQLEDNIRGAVLAPVLADSPVEPDARTRILINPGGEFVWRRTLTRRGPHRAWWIPTGATLATAGGALSGKDPTHIDRFGAYVARHLARNVVTAELTRRCEIHLSYAIGEARPLAVSMETVGTGATPDEVLEPGVSDVIDLQPLAVLGRLELQYPPARHGGVFYRRLGAYGHFCRQDLDLPWEREDLAAAPAAATGPVG